MKIPKLFKKKMTELVEVSRPENPLEGDRQIIGHLQGMGVDLDRPVFMRFFMYFGSEEAANAAGRAVAANEGFEVGVSRGPDRNSYLVLATGSFPATEKSVAEMRTLFEHIAEEEGGEFDGWEAAIPS